MWVAIWNSVSIYIHEIHPMQSNSNFKSRTLRWDCRLRQPHEHHSFESSHQRRKASQLCHCSRHLSSSRSRIFWRARRAFSTVCIACDDPGIMQCGGLRTAGLYGTKNRCNQEGLEPLLRRLHDFPALNLYLKRQTLWKST